LRGAVRAACAKHREIAENALAEIIGGVCSELGLRGLAIDSPGTIRSGNDRVRLEPFVAPQRSRATRRVRRGGKNTCQN